MLVGLKRTLVFTALLSATVAPIASADNEQVVSATCGRCGKAVDAADTMKGAGKVWHKGCFTCATCQQALTLATFYMHDGNIYCKTHLPKPRPTDIAIEAARPANPTPKTPESAGATPKAASGGIDMHEQHSLSAPKKATPGMGTPPKAAPGANSAGSDPMQGPLSGPKRSDESTGRTPKKTSTPQPAPAEPPHGN